MSEEETRRIIASQMAIEKKVKVADFIIRNEGSIAQTRRKTREVFQELRRIALQKRRKPGDP
jgi:dephospho-CoA kinase